MVTAASTHLTSSSAGPKDTEDGVMLVVCWAHYLKFAVYPEPIARSEGLLGLRRRS